MKWFVIGAVVVGAGVLLLVNSNSGSQPTGGSNTFGMAMYGGYPGASSAGNYGMAMYGGFHDSNMAPRGYWRPNTLEGQ